MAVETEEFLTVAEAARTARISEQAMYRMIRAGQVRSIRFGRAIRVPRSALTASAEAASVEEVAA